MPPVPEDDKSFTGTSRLVGEKLSHPQRGDEVVISGIAGFFPECDNVKEFQDNLLNKVDMVTDDDRRWKPFHPEIPQSTGKIKTVNFFDASFFGVHSKQARIMDPMCRLLMETAYAAIIDAGVNPKSLKNSKTGVYIGSATCESEKSWFYEKVQINGFGLTGCSKSMLANRISYWLDATGPSYTLESSCASSMYALDLAYREMRNGSCEMAIVGGTNLCLTPYISLQFSRLGVLSNVHEARCKSFDDSCSGYVRAETIAVVFLQKAKNARRVYSQILHIKSNFDGCCRENGIVSPNPIAQEHLIKDFYNECQIQPSSIDYIEASAAGVRNYDIEELILMDTFFCKGRKEPLKIGSVKSNMGHAEPASGLAALIKMCIAYNTGILPPNLHYKKPLAGIRALADGRMQVVQEATKWNKGLVAINNFGVNGANSHLLLKNYCREKKNHGIPEDNLPRLVCISGRTESTVRNALASLESKRIDNEEIGLFQAIHDIEIPGHIYRGYTLLRPHSEPMVASSEVQHSPGSKRPVWFVFSGMGSQWAGMGKELMEIPVFRRAIQRCDNALRPKGLDIVNIITEPDPKIFDNILNSFVGIAACQIGIVDILKELGIEPDNIIGHSVGELGCAYADRCLSSEQMILAAYYRGLASIETPLIDGSMAAVGLGYKEIKDYCPDDIEIACHNGPDSSTISGPAESMKVFVDKLQGQGIFAKEVNCSHIAYHSRYIAEAGVKLLEYLRKIIPNPLPRTAKWISSSVPKSRWDEELAKYSSAEYHTNNLLSAVLFEESSAEIHSNAITIEIAPHGLLQAILRRSLKKECTNIALTKRGFPNNVEYLLTNIGKLFELGLNPKLLKIYPPIQWPVSAQTPMLSPFVGWSHDEFWPVHKYSDDVKVTNYVERIVRVSYVDEETDYITGNVIDNRNIFPFTEYLMFAWETFVQMMQKGIDNPKQLIDIPVIFEDIRFMKPVTLQTNDELEFLIMVQKGSGKFEISENEITVASGIIRMVQHISAEFRDISDPLEPTGDYIKVMKTEDVYREFRMRGYDYCGKFKSIKTRNVSGTRGEIYWNNNWATFIDSMIQMKVLSMDTKEIYIPNRIDKLCIDPRGHLQICQNSPEDKSLPATVHEDINIIRCGRIDLKGLTLTTMNRKTYDQNPLLEEYIFVPYFAKTEMTNPEILRYFTQIALENLTTNTVKVIESLDSNKELLMPLVLQSLEDIPTVKAESMVIGNRDANFESKIGVLSRIPSKTDSLIFIGTNLLENLEEMQHSLDCLADDGFLISRENLAYKSIKNLDKLDILGCASSSTDCFVLLRRKMKKRCLSFVKIKTSNTKFDWIESLSKEIKNNHRLIQVSQFDSTNGLLGLSHYLKKETKSINIGSLLMMDEEAPVFNPDLPIYKEQIDKNLAVNILKKGQWGTYRHLKIRENRKIPCEHAYLTKASIGNLTNFRWVQGSLKNGPHTVRVYYSGLNFCEIMMSTGYLSIKTQNRLDQDTFLGLEFAGRTASGSRVMGIVKNKAITNLVVPDNDLLWPVPDEWSLEEAATVPMAYATVYYALVMMSKIERGMKILIHAGDGAIGQAAINLCLHMGLEVFTTVFSRESRITLKRLFPDLQDDHIGNSNDYTFQDMIMSETKAEGVDIVFNSLGEDKLEASVGCLSFRGKFLDVGKYITNTDIGMGFFLRECYIKGILIDHLLVGTSDEKQILRSLVMDGIKNGCVKPLPSRCFKTDEIEKAYRLLSARKYAGKVMIKVRDEESDASAKPTNLYLSAEPRYLCESEKTYIIIDGLGECGFELIDWLIIRGARRLILNSVRGIDNGYKCSRIRTWKSYGVHIEVVNELTSTESGCVSLLKNALTLGSVSAIFYLDGVPLDLPFEKQTKQILEVSCTPKIMAVRNLDEQTRKLCPDLRDFVVFSNISSSKGNVNHTNSAIANSIVERICEDRKESGLPAIVIQWGSVKEVSTMDSKMEGILKQTINSCLKTLDIFLTQQSTIVSSTVLKSKPTKSCDRTIIEMISAITGIKNFSTEETTLQELGIDSIMYLEIIQCLDMDYNIKMKIEELRQEKVKSIFQLSEKTEERRRETLRGLKDSSLHETSSVKILIKSINNEMDAAIPAYNMMTKFGDDKWHVHIDDEEPRIYIIPGITGSAKMFETQCKKLRAKVTVLQYGFDGIEHSFKEIALKLMEFIRIGLRKDRPFVFLGYSYGVAVAIEIIQILENEGYFGTLICLDGSPEMIYTLLGSEYSLNDESKLQEALLQRISEIFSIENHPFKEISVCVSWEDKFMAFRKSLLEKEDITQNKLYILTVAFVMYGRLKLILQSRNTLTKKLRSKCLLIRPTVCSSVVKKEDYGLNEFFENPIEIQKLDCNHFDMVDNIYWFKIVNRVASGKSIGMSE